MASEHIMLFTFMDGDTWVVMRRGDIHRELLTYNKKYGHYYTDTNVVCQYSGSHYYDCYVQLYQDAEVYCILNGIDISTAVDTIRSKWDE